VGGASGTSYDKVTVQLGASAASGNIVLTTSSGRATVFPSQFAPGTSTLYRTPAATPPRDVCRALGDLTHARDAMSPEILSMRAPNLFECGRRIRLVNLPEVDQREQRDGQREQCVRCLPGEVANLGTRTTVALPFAHG